jgi:hypothetical protein
MVKFTTTAFIIEVECGINPIESWLDTHEQMIDVLQSEASDMAGGNRYHYLELLRQMMPELKVAKKMCE